jgi:hypothetical protein
MRSATKIRIPANESKLLTEILGLLDPNESVTITFKSIEDDDEGCYEMQFSCQQPFDPDLNKIQFIE